MRVLWEARPLGLAKEASRHRRLRGALRLCPALLLLLLAPPGAAEATFTSEGAITTSSREAVSPNVAMDQAGNSVFVWQRINSTFSGYQVELRRRSAAGALSATQILSGLNAGGARVGVDSGGNAIVVWSRADGTDNPDCGRGGCSLVETRRRSPTGALNATQLLSAPGQNAGSARVAVEADGDAVFAWSRNDGTTGCGGNGCSRIQVRARTAAGALSATQTLSAAGQHAFSPEIGLDGSGNAIISWGRNDGTNPGNGCCERVQARARSAAGVLSATQTLSAAGQHAFESQVAVNASGKAVFTWNRIDGTTGCGGAGCSRIQARARSAAGALSPPQTLSVAGGTQNSSLPRVAIDSGGSAVFAWSRRNPTGCGGASCSKVEAVARSSGGTISTTQVLSRPGEEGNSPDVAMTPSGNAVFVWLDRDDTTACFGIGCLRVRARSTLPGGHFSATETLSSPSVPTTSGLRPDAWTPVVAVDPNGGRDAGIADAAATWSRTPDGNSQQIEIAVQIAP